MKRKTYLILIWTVTLCVIVFSSAKAFFKTKRFFYNFYEDFSTDFDDFVQSQLPEFSKIILDANIMEVKIREGESGTIKCGFSNPKLKPEYKVENGILIISQKNTSKLKFSQNCNLTITVPENTVLTQAQIKTNIGEIKISDVEIQNLTVQMNIGEIEMNNTQFNNLNGKLNIGNFSVDNLNSIDDFNKNLGVNIGEIKIESNNFGRNFRQKGVQSKEIEIHLNIGEIDLN